MVSDSKPFPQGEEGFFRWSKIRVSNLLAKNTLSENKGGCQRLWIILWNCVFMYSIFLQSNRCCGWRKGAWDHSDKGMSFLAEYGKTQGFESVSKAEAKGNICAGTCLQLGNLWNLCQDLELGHIVFPHVTSFVQGLVTVDWYI
jgi:hypothetical protein